MKFSLPTAKLNRHTTIAALVVAIAAFAAWFINGIYLSLASSAGVKLQHTGVIYLLTFILLTWSTLVSYFDRPTEVSRSTQAKLNKLNLVVSVPVYNEDPDLLARCLESIFTQKRTPQHVYVVDDGSTEVVNYKAVKSWAVQRAASKHIKLTWKRTMNGGKRSAQAYAVRGTKDADIYVTVDSDSVVDKMGFKEGLKPFADQRVQSVAGIVISINNTETILARFINMWYLSAQLVGRSTMSVMGSVMVNSGALAFYRADNVRKNLKPYLNEKFFSKDVKMSDDSMLTLFSHIKGKTVQQTSSIVFSAMPVKYSHHLRQYTRWMRGSFIRSWWRVKYLPTNKFAFWTQVMSWFQSMASMIIMLILIVMYPSQFLRVLPSILFIQLLIGLVYMAKYFSISRSDESTLSQLATYALVPMAVLWNYIVLRFIKWYAILTCTNPKWGTRLKVEVTA